MWIRVKCKRSETLGGGGRQIQQFWNGKDFIIPKKEPVNKKINQFENIKI